MCFSLKLMSFAPPPHFWSCPPTPMQVPPPLEVMNRRKFQSLVSPQTGSERNWQYLLFFPDTPQYQKKTFFVVLAAIDVFKQNKNLQIIQIVKKNSKYLKIQSNIIKNSNVEYAMKTSNKFQEFNFISSRVFKKFNISVFIVIVI